MWLSLTYYILSATNIDTYTKHLKPTFFRSYSSKNIIILNINLPI